jgi:hypothetical protein
VNFSEGLPAGCREEARDKILLRLIDDNCHVCTVEAFIASCESDCAYYSSCATNQHRMDTVSIDRRKKRVTAILLQSADHESILLY